MTKNKYLTDYNHINIVSTVPKTFIKKEKGRKFTRQEEKVSVQHIYAD